MGDLLIRNISDALKRDIAAAADRTGRSLSDEAKELLRKGLIAESDIKPVEEQSAYDVLRAVFGAGDGSGDDFAAILDEVEAERKRDFGRPPVEFG
ncbi:plasmid stabilization protein [Pararhizobium polonicum]|jgi:plasmid stability protein|uniref:Plasmid stabilization protein n=1 Tax=Pararhizobium polonicum TaxID=1612624 RepID=A0A1C7P6I4_9HYPH|nr:plasmid stabilization protein [Pararhizobium polonicum]OBZ96830.1 plasmid stabilization protein [Pararhizobium polonicum]